MVASSRIKTSTGYTVYTFLGGIEEVQEEINMLYATYPPATFGTETREDMISDDGRRVIIWRYDAGGPRCSGL